MAKELQWFKFIISEWNNGDIVLCSLPAQGLFINILCLYWSKECNLEIRKMYKHLPATCKESAAGQRFNSELLNELINEDVIKVEGDRIRIHFMDEQKVRFAEIVDRNSVNGKKGGRGNKKQNKSENKPTALKNESETKADTKAKESQREKNKILRESKTTEEVYNSPVTKPQTPTLDPYRGSAAGSLSSDQEGERIDAIELPFFEFSNRLRKANLIDLDGHEKLLDGFSRLELFTKEKFSLEVMDKKATEINVNDLMERIAKAPKE